MKRWECDAIVHETRAMIAASMRRGSIVFLLCIAVLVHALPTSAMVPPFPDMADSWYRYQESVSYLRQHDVISGYDDGTFQPHAPVNRAEFLKIVFKGRGGNEPVESGRRCFSDVNPRQWYAPFVCAAKRRGIVSGYPDGTFQPEQNVNTAEALKIVLLAYGREIPESTGSQWYEAYASILDEEDILPRHSYLPWEDLSRQRAADLIARFVRHDEERVLANLSPGCGKAPDSTPTTVTVNGIEREFLLTIPSDYVSHDPSPLIVAFHGRTNDNAMVRSYFGLDRAAQKYFIAYPAALRKDNGTFSWSDPNDTGSKLRDVAFFDALVQKIGNDYCIDMDRIYVVGHSLGAWMANSIACIRGDVIRASATVGGDSMLTDCAGPTAALIIHNPEDTLAPFHGAELVRDLRIKENACGQQKNVSQPESLRCEIYEGCDGGNPVIFCPHTQDRDFKGNYYPHVWPEETGEDIVKFFEGLERSSAIANN